MKLSAALACLWAMFVVPVPAIADAIDDGFTAFDRQDYATASRLWGALANAGDPRGQTLLAWLYQMGKGVPLDEARGADLLRKAADQGFLEAEARLGMLYMHSTTLRDQGQGFRWLQRAAVRGHALAMKDLAAAHAQGHGTQKNEIQALVWLNLAIVRLRAENAASEVKTALSNRSYLQGQLSAADRSKAEAQSDEWTARLPPLAKQAWSPPPSAHGVRDDAYPTVQVLLPDALAPAGSAGRRQFENYVAVIGGELVAMKVICIPPTMSASEVTEAYQWRIASSISPNAVARTLVRAVLKSVFECGKSEYKYW